MVDWSKFSADFTAESLSQGNIARGARGLPGGSLQTSPDMIKLLAEAWNAEKLSSFITVEPCPQCGLDKLNLYHIKQQYYLCECQDCGIYGSGENHAEAFKATEDAIGDGLDWRDQLVPEVR